jgi:hypothetical protein
MVVKILFLQKDRRIFLLSGRNVLDILTLKCWKELAKLPRPSLYNCLPARWNLWYTYMERKSAKIPVWRKIRELLKTVSQRQTERVNKANLMLERIQTNKDFVLFNVLKNPDWLLVCRKDLERLKAESKRNEDKVVKTELGKETRS